MFYIWTLFIEMQAALLSLSSLIIASCLHFIFIYAFVYLTNYNWALRVD